MMLLGRENKFMSPTFPFPEIQPNHGCRTSKLINIAVHWKEGSMYIEL